MENIINEVFPNSHSIAVIGIKPDFKEPAFKVPSYMQSQSYRIIPVNPKFAGGKILDEYVYRNITEVQDQVDIVNIFRKPEHLPVHVNEILSMKLLPRYVWFQLGIRNDEAARLLEDSGIKVVQNRCIMVEHIRYIRC